MSDKYITYFKKYYKIGALIIVISFFLFAIKPESKEEYVEEIPQIEVIEEKAVVEVVEEEIYVDIKGAVKTPGVYKMASGNRVIDVVIKSGGLITLADTKNVNLSKLISDEMVIYIPKFDETICTQEIEDEIEPTKDGNTNLISINKASQSELETLPKIGSSKALDIIKYREENGPFKVLEDLKKVSGIGDATFEALKAFITL